MSGFALVEFCWRTVRSSLTQFSLLATKDARRLPESSSDSVENRRILLCRSDLNSRVAKYQSASDAWRGLGPVLGDWGRQLMGRRCVDGGCQDTGGERAGG